MKLVDSSGRLESFADGPNAGGAMFIAVHIHATR